MIRTSSTDTQACIAGGIAEAFYGMPDEIIKDMANHLPPDYKAEHHPFGGGVIISMQKGTNQKMLGTMIKK